MEALFLLRRPQSARCHISRLLSQRRAFRFRSEAELSPPRRLPKTPCRTRFAPSPTGYLHLGSLRTALFNYLLARATGGQFLLRLEDTDQSRVVPDSEQRLYEDLRWAGLSWDEGPDIGGPYGPYKQSLRLGTYASLANELLEKDKAYRCFCSPEEIQKYGAEFSDPYVVRFKSPSKPISFRDLAYGDNMNYPAQTDFIIMKRDGFPTYHLANVVDDHLMEITHVIRGAEWLISTPKHVALYNAFGWEAPQFAHVALLLDEKREKLSKRLGASMAVFKDQNVIPEALLNFAVLLGWYRGKNSEVLTLNDMAKEFSMKFTRGDVVVDFGKLRYLQKQHVSLLVNADPPDMPTLTERFLKPIAAIILKLEASRAASEFPLKENAETALLSGAEGLVMSETDLKTQEPLHAYIMRLLKIARISGSNFERLVLENRYVIWRPRASEIKARLSNLLYDLGSSSSIRLDGASSTPAKAMDYVVEKLAAVGGDNWNGENLREVTSLVGKNITQSRSSNAAGFRFLRWALLAYEQGPPLVGVMEIFGKEETLRRLEVARKIAHEAESVLTEEDMQSV